MNKKIILLILFAIVLQSACEDEVTPPTTITPIEYGSLSGIVIDSETAEPISGALVEAVLSQVSDSTDSSGAFFLDSLLLGDESITVISDFFESQILEINITPDSQSVNVSMGSLLENQYLYIAQWGGHDLHIIDVDKQEKVDSLYFSEGIISKLTITPGGTKLYIFDADVHNFFYLDTKTKIFNSTNLPSGLLKFSAYDDQLFLFSDDGIFKVDTLTDVAVQIDNVNLRQSVFNVVFSPTAPVLYFNKRGLLFTYDYQQAMILDSSKISISRMAVTPDGSELYFIGDYVGVWDIQNDSLSEIYSLIDTSIISIISSLSSIAITPDGDYALITEGVGDIFFIQPDPKGLITVINTSSHKFHGYIDLKPFGGTSIDILFSRSGRYAYINKDFTGISLIDLLKMKTLKSIKFYIEIRSMAIGPKN